MSSDKNSSLFTVNYSLGFLELEVMRIIWRNKETSVRNVVNIIQKKRPIAYTTIMTVMDNLYKKGFLTRKKIKKSYYYCPTNTENTAIKSSLKKTIANLTDGYGNKQVLFSTLAVTLLPDIAVLSPNSTRTIRMYRAPIGHGILLTLLSALFILSIYDLFLNLQFFGTFDYLRILSTVQISSLDQLRLSLAALLESLPISNILTTVILSAILFVLVKKLLILLDFKTLHSTYIGGAAS